MISWFYGRKVLQSFYKKLYSFALKGLNYGTVGSGEKWALEFVKASLKKDSVILLDVGANIGDYSKDLREVFGEKAIIHAFEPVPATFKTLKSNITALDIVSHEFGLGRSNEILEINYSEEQHTFSSVFDRAAFDNVVSQKVPIEIRTLDSFCIQNGISFVDFVKIDTEGNDYACLEGALEMIQTKRIRYIQFEFGESAIDANVYFKSFWELLSPHFKVYRILKDGLEEIGKYHVRHETFYYSNFLAELK